MKSRQGSFSILTELAGVLLGSLGEHIPVLIPGKVLVHTYHLRGPRKNQSNSVADPASLHSLSTL